MKDSTRLLILAGKKLPLKPDDCTQIALDKPKNYETIFDFQIFKFKKKTSLKIIKIILKWIQLSA